MEDLAGVSRLKEKFGEEVVTDLDQWMGEKIQSETGDQYRQILSRLDILEDRYEGVSDEVYRLRGEMNGFRTEVNQRFDAMNDSINQRFDAMNDSINQRFDTMNNSIDQRFDMMKSTIDQRFDVIDQRFDVIDQRFFTMNNSIDQRFDTMKISIDQQFNIIYQRFDVMNNNINQRFDVMNERILSGIKWSVGTIATFGLIITILITVFKFL